MKEGERIFYYDGSKNWWSRSGNEANTPVGDPCGPDSEMFYDFGTPHDPELGRTLPPELRLWSLYGNWQQCVYGVQKSRRRAV